MHTVMCRSAAATAAATHLPFCTSSVHHPDDTLSDCLSLSLPCHMPLLSSCAQVRERELAYTSTRARSWALIYVDTIFIRTDRSVGRSFARVSIFGDDDEDEAPHLLSRFPLPLSLYPSSPISISPRRRASSSGVLALVPLSCSSAGLRYRPRSQRACFRFPASDFSSRGPLFHPSLVEHNAEVSRISGRYAACITQREHIWVRWKGILSLLWRIRAADFRRESVRGI